MRIERRGGAPDLQTAFKKFVVRRLGGRALDDNQDAEAAEGKFPDFACFRDIVLMEMKHLETDQHDRINEVFDTEIDPAEKPIFYGQREGHFITENVSNGEAIKNTITSKLSRTIEKLLHQANRQFSSYRSRHPCKNSVSICIILNSTLREFTPETVIHAIQGKMKLNASGELRFPAIDAILYISEKHFKILPDGRIGLAVGIFEAAGTVFHPWKQQFVDRIVETWSRMRTGSKPVPSEDVSHFDPIHDIPKTMSRSDSWYLEYQRRPYMSALPVERLKVLFNRCVAKISVSFVKGNWPKPPMEEAMKQGRVFAHLIEETNRRGLDLRQFGRNTLTPEQEMEVYAGLPPELVAILTGKAPSATDGAQG